MSTKTIEWFQKLDDEHFPHLKRRWRKMTRSERIAHGVPKGAEANIAVEHWLTQDWRKS